MALVGTVEFSGPRVLVVGQQRREVIGFVLPQEEPGGGDLHGGSSQRCAVSACTAARPDVSMTSAPASISLSTKSALSR